MPTAIDTSVLIAAVSSWHEAHERCLNAVDSILAEPPVLLSQHVLTESYSVLTRLPSPHRLAPRTALSLLEETLSGVAEVVCLPPNATWHLLTGLTNADVAGGATHDAFILHSAVAGGADRILTLNDRHFERLAPAGIEVVTP